MKGLGLLTDKPPTITRSPYFYGIKTRQLYSGWRNSDDNVEADSLGIKWATDQIKWFVRKNDSIQPGKDLLTTYNCHWLLRPADFASASSHFSLSQRKKHGSAARDAEQNIVYRDIVFVTSNEDDAPTRFKELNKGKLVSFLLEKRPLCPFSFLATLWLTLSQTKPTFSYCTAT